MDDPEEKLFTGRGREKMLGIRAGFSVGSWEAERWGPWGPRVSDRFGAGSWEGFRRTGRLPAGTYYIGFRSYFCR